MKPKISKKIRLRYSGLTIFSSKILSVFTGLAFTVIVTRNLSIIDFGVWQYLTLIFSYVIIPANLIPFWLTRSYARGNEVAKTGVIGNLFLSIPSFIVFLLASNFASRVVETDLTYFYIISFQIFLNYLILSLTSIAMGSRPYLSGYGSIAFEVSKVFFAVLLFHYLGLGLIGAIITVIFADLIQLFFLLYSLRGEYIDKFQWKTLRRWLHSSWLPLYSLTERFIYTLDLFILSILTKASEPLAFYKVAFIIATVITYSSSISSALYPKLLGGGSRKDIEEIFKITYMFAIPMAIGAFILAEPILHILKPEYIVSAPILRMMAIWGLIYPLLIISNGIITGTETVDSIDVRNRLSSKKLLKSRLFTWPLCRYVRSGVLLLLTYVFISIFLNRFPEHPYLYAAMGCFLAKLISDAGLSIFALKIARRALFFKIPLKNLIKYFSSSIIMTVIILVLSPLRFLETILTIGVGALIYFTFLLLIDVESRKLFKQTWRLITAYARPTT